VSTEFKGMTVDQITSYKKHCSEQYMNQLTAKLTKQLLSVLKWFGENCPNHTLEWVDGMGTGFFVLNGDIQHWNTVDSRYTASTGSTHYVDAEPPNRVAEYLEPCWDFYQMFFDATEEIHSCGNCVGDYHFHPDTGVGEGKADMLGQRRGVEKIQ